MYKHNFPEVTLLNRNIQSLTPTFINNLGVSTILMSPPCQPFTRNGIQGDISDDRTKSFLHILLILPQLNVDRILIENVKGFENSKMRELLIETLTKCGFIYQEFILSPTQIGVANSRSRYYCLAKKSPNNFSFEIGSLVSFDTMCSFKLLVSQLLMKTIFFVKIFCLNCYVLFCNERDVKMSASI